ncbi:MAG: hypothetical protein WCO84_01930 [bacterium]
MLNNFITDYNHPREYSANFGDFSERPFDEEETITPGQRRRLHDLIFSHFDDISTTQQCLNHIEDLTRSEAEAYIRSLEE